MKLFLLAISIFWITIGLTAIISPSKLKKFVIVQLLQKPEMLKATTDYPDFSDFVLTGFTGLNFF